MIHGALQAHQDCRSAANRFAYLTACFFRSFVIHFPVNKHFNWDAQLLLYHLHFLLCTSSCLLNETRDIWDLFSMVESRCKHIKKTRFSPTRRDTNFCGKISSKPMKVPRRRFIFAIDEEVEFLCKSLTFNANRLVDCVGCTSKHETSRLSKFFLKHPMRLRHRAPPGSYSPRLTFRLTECLKLRAIYVFTNLIFLSTSTSQQQKEEVEIT